MFDIAHIGDAIAVNRSMALPGREAVAVERSATAPRGAPWRNRMLGTVGLPARSDQDARRSFAPAVARRLPAALAPEIDDRADVGDGEHRRIALKVR